MPRHTSLPDAAPPRPAVRAGAAVPLGRRCAWALSGLLVLVSASGAGCPRVLQQYTQPIPRALPPAASLAQVIDVVNDNSARVQSVSTNRATVSTPGFPSLNANIAFQRPRSFRLVGQKFMSPELDLGSNDELIWFWMRRAQPPAMFFCRHEQFATSAARQILPVEPEWLIEALGVVSFDKSGPIEGPSPVGNNRLEVKTKSLNGGAGASKLTIVDASSGIVLEQHVYDAQGVRIASAVMSKHARDPVSGVTLPRHVEIQMPPASLSFSVDLADLQINQLPPGQQELFVKPAYNGYNEVDLANPNGTIVPSASGPSRAPPSVRY